METNRHPKNSTQTYLNKAPTHQKNQGLNTSKSKTAQQSSKHQNNLFHKTEKKTAGARPRSVIQIRKPQPRLSFQTLVRVPAPLVKETNLNRDPF